ncbi:MAG: hypothetical protein LBL97_06495 [Prevotellaceae bacterium]|jgi:hypothetical protein|nr:hypothetical protein [Prevotellaceae bacterium]
MKATFLLFSMLSATLTATAQATAPKDTTLYVDGRKITVQQADDNIKVSLFEARASGDTIQLQQVFEGVYLNGRSIERTTVVSIPFVKKHNRYQFDPHYPTFYVGFSQLSGGAMRYSAADHVPQVMSKSWEWGFNFCNTGIAVSADNHWGITTTIGIARMDYKLDNNYGFEKVDDITACVPAADGTVYQKSWLRYWAWRIPVSIEWQALFGSTRAFLAAGPELEWRMGITSRAKYNDKKHTLSDKLNANPLGVNLLLQAGYGDVGFQARFALTSLFQKHKGPDLYPASIGVGFYW